MPPGARGKRVPFHGIAHVGIGEVRYERDDLEGALHHAEEGVRLTELGGFTSYMLAGHATLVRVCQARGDWPGSEETLRKVQRIVEAHPFPYMQGVFAELRVRQWVAQGKVAALRQWTAARELQAEGPTGLAGEIDKLGFARALIALWASGMGGERRSLDTAMELLARLAETADEAGRGGSVIRILALQSVGYYQQGARDLALQALARALSLAEPQGYVRSFVDEGAIMEELLQEALRDGLAPGYCTTLLAAFAEGPTAESPATAGLVEPLSEREVEVLRLIAAGLSNREIAEELIIALSTVKSHINNMYGKLGVRSRTQAIARSQDLGLL
jgi:LuxR family maltose regulon positive regulatory protein